MTVEKGSKTRGWKNRLVKGILAAMLFVILGLILTIGIKYNGTYQAVVWKLQGCPEVIIEFVLKYPEAKSFAENYSDSVIIMEPVDVTDEVVKGEIPVWIQWDPRWAYYPYGSSFLGVTGCGPTCLSMVYCGLTGDASMTPDAIAGWAQETGFYVYGVGTSWDMMTTGARMLGLEAESIGTDEKSVRKSLQEGHPVIASVGPGDFTYEGHFIVITELEPDGTAVIHDPNSRVNSSRTWELSKLLSQVKEIWSYDYNRQVG